MQLHRFGQPFVVCQESRRSYRQTGAETSRSRFIIRGRPSSTWSARGFFTRCNIAFRTQPPRELTGLPIAASCWRAVLLGNERRLLFGISCTGSAQSSRAGKCSGIPSCDWISRDAIPRIWPIKLTTEPAKARGPAILLSCPKGHDQTGLHTNTRAWQRTANGLSCHGTPVLSLLG